MTDDPEEPASGIPERTERSERTESGRHITESGRHVTNRNIVPRSGTAAAEPSDPRSAPDEWSGPDEDPFDVVTPVRPEPRDVFVEEEVVLSHDADEDLGAPSPPGPAPLPSSGPRAVLRHLETPIEDPPPAVRGDVRTDPADYWGPDDPTGTGRDDPWDATPAARAPTRRAPTQRGLEDVHAVEPLPLGSAALDRGLRALAVAVVLGLGAVGLARPGAVLSGGAAWLLCLWAAATGWGTFVVRLARAHDPAPGLRAALGVAGYTAVAGLLVAAGVLTRPVVLALIAVGIAGFAWHELTAPVASWHRVRRAAAFARAQPALAALVLVLVGLAALRVLGAIAALDRNPWDDDIAYTPLVKRLLDTGDLVEPFSFRRLGAYGGQTVLQALAGARGTLANIHLVDKGLAFALALALTLGYARERRTQPVWLALLALCLLVLPDTAINTASHWTAVVGCFALYRVLLREQWAMVGLVAASTCALRQNLLAPVAIFIAAVLLMRLATLRRTAPLGEAWRTERGAWAAIAGAALLALAPWWIAAYASGRTFLFPAIDGTWNHALSLAPAVTSWADELGALAAACLEPTPFVVLPLLALPLVFVVDRRLGRPLLALGLAAAVGFAALAHGFAGSEPAHLWRYAFGFVTTLTIALVLEIGAGDDARVSLAPLGRWIVLASLALQIATGRGALPKQLAAAVDDLREAAAVERRGDPSALAERRRYTAMQAAIPSGAAAVFLLDDPAHLDFRRNVLANLDVPGFASPGEQLPAFRGPEALRAYLVAQGYGYAAYVRPDRSRYAFRRQFWLQRLFTDAELFQIMSAYTLDVLDDLEALARRAPPLHDADGLVVLDLAGLAAAPAPAPSAAEAAIATIGPEPRRRAAWVRALAEREGLGDAWKLTTRADLRFEDGFAGLRFVDGSVDDPRWYDVTHPRGEPPRRGTPVLPMYRRAHLRVRGDTEMRLALRAAISLGTVYTHPRLDVSLDGELLASVVADASGRFTLEVTVPRDKLAGGWHDVYLVLGTAADPDRELRELRVARLEAVEWAPP